MSYEISTIPNFDRELKNLSKKYHSIKDDLTDLIKSLKQNPPQGESWEETATK